jgi:hypothetical protein
MPEQITYYAIVDEFSSRRNPGGVLRRIRNDDGVTDEAFSSELTWQFSPLLAGAERGDTMFDFIPISEAEAAQIVDRIKEQAASGE